MFRNQKDNQVEALKVKLLTKGLSGGSNNYIAALGVLSNGDLVAGIANKTINIKIGDVKKHEWKKTLMGHKEAVLCFAMLPNGDLVSGSRDDTIKIWDAKTLDCKQTLSGHKKGVNALVVLPNGGLFSGDGDKILKIWDAKTYSCNKTLEGHTDAVRALLVLASGDLVSASSDKSIMIWDIKTLKCKEVLKGHNSSVVALTILLNGDLVSGSSDATIKIWHGETFACRQVLKGHNSSVMALKILPNGDIVSGSLDRTIKIWDKERFVCKETLEHDGNVGAIAVLPNGILASGLLTLNVWLWEFRTPQDQLLWNDLPYTTYSEKHSVTNDKPISDNMPIVYLSNSSQPNLSQLMIPFEIPYLELKLGSQLGAGGYGVVYQATYQFNEIAVKQLHINFFTTESLKEFQNEMKIMANLNSPNIVKLFGVCTKQQPYCIVMEYMAGGSLYERLHSKSEIDWKIRYSIGLDVAKGVYYLHSKSIMHRDLKSLNVLLDKNDTAKLTDFGLSKVKTETASSTKNQSVGTLAWMAPELFKRKAVFTQKSDMYSYGMVLWELAARDRPFKDATNQALISTWVSQGQREEIPNDTPEPVKELIKQCWEAEPEKRPSAEQAVEFLLQHQGFFAQSSGSGKKPMNPQPSYQGNLYSQGPQSGPSYYNNFSQKH